MEYVALGRTNLMVSRTSFGTGGVENNTVETATSLMKAGYEAGVNFFDIACCTEANPVRYAFYDIRNSVILGAQTTSQTASSIMKDVEQFLIDFQTDYIDILHVHNLSFVPVPKQEDGVYETLLSLKSKGKIRHIGFSSDSLLLAQEAADSGLFGIIRYPFNYLANEEEQEFVKYCEQKEIGFIAYKPLSGGKIKNIPLAFGFLRNFDSAVPVWGFSTEEQLQQLLYFESRPPLIDEQFMAEIAREKALLSGL